MCRDHLKKKGTENTLYGTKLIGVVVHRSFKNIIREKIKWDLQVVNVLSHIPMKTDDIWFSIRSISTSVLPNNHQLNLPIQPRARVCDL
ncbi:hypothetical protein GLYMA_14G184900v4 [Glycine max]|uniref:Uncharacterized protein n=1 Tax=Glycine max TaxID=3847 RepID=K7M7V8_SOYBN|nr:hypothetical protein GLYMA_14G184900v4 [Glycine max]